LDEPLLLSDHHGEGDRAILVQLQRNATHIDANHNTAQHAPAGALQEDELTFDLLA
jgi:hypothetical protein